MGQRGTSKSYDGDSSERATIVAMPSAPVKPTIVGRWGSHFTRTARIFAGELGVDYHFRIVRDLMSPSPADYGGNPALKMPALETPQGTWFGALNVCRELARQSPRNLDIVWPENLDTPRLANAQELTVSAMGTEVALILGKIAGTQESALHLKMQKSLLGTLSWLEDNVPHLPHLPHALPAARDLSFLEVTLFCLVTHIAFRDVVPLGPYPALNRFAQDFGARASCIETAFRFDA